MIISPQRDCTWTYYQGRLSINLTTDEGVSYLFKTHFDVESLYERPDVNTPFTIADAQLLTTYQDGVDKILKDEGKALDLGLNAVACMRFVKPAIPTSRWYLPYGGRNVEFDDGDVVTIYTKSGNVGDCLVLTKCDADGLTRLMLLNRFLLVDGNKGVLLGQMIRVRPDCVCAFRSIQGGHVVRYA